MIMYNKTDDTLTSTMKTSHLCVSLNRNTVPPLGGPFPQCAPLPRFPPLVCASLFSVFVRVFINLYCPSTSGRPQISVTAARPPINICRITGHYSRLLGLHLVNIRKFPGHGDTVGVMDNYQENSRAQALLKPSINNKEYSSGAVGFTPQPAGTRSPLLYVLSCFRALITKPAVFKSQVS